MNAYATTGSSIGREAGLVKGVAKARLTKSSTFTGRSCVGGREGTGTQIANPPETDVYASGQSRQTSKVSTPSVSVGRSKILRWRSVLRASSRPARQCSSMLTCENS
jgi:hypothetical protein